MKFQGLIKETEKIVKKYAPQILTGLGCVGVVATAILAAKAAPEAEQAIEDEFVDRQLDDANFKMRDFKFIEKVKLTWRYYIPTALTGATSIACIVGSQSISRKRSVALTAAYTLSQKALEEYKNAVIETVGEEKANEIHQKAAAKTYSSQVSKDGLLVMNDDPSPFYDGFTGGRIITDVYKLRDAMVNLNYKLMREDYASLNDFYDEVGIPHIGLGDDNGWTATDGPIYISFFPKIDENYKLKVYFEYSVMPHEGYDLYG